MLAVASVYAMSLPLMPRHYAPFSDMSAAEDAIIDAIACTATTAAAFVHVARPSALARALPPSDIADCRLCWMSCRANIRGAPRATRALCRAYVRARLPFQEAVPAARLPAEEACFSFQ